MAEDKELKPGSGYQIKPLSDQHISINSQQPMASLPTTVPPAKPKPKG